jgi:hypothetical protein
MKTVYIAHPLRGNVQNNIQKVHAICQQYHEEGEIIPMSPLHAFGFVNPAGDQELVFKYCFTLLSKCDELWLHDDWEKSEGCRLEKEFAERSGIPIRCIDREGRFYE